MKTKLINLAVAGLFSVTAASAVAEEAFSGSWYVMPTIGGMHADADVEQDNGIDPSYGIRLGKQLNEKWDVQFGATYVESDVDITGRPSGEYKQTLVGLDFLYMLSRDAFRPFLLAGIGAARNEIDGYDNLGKVDEDNWSWMANVGAGFQYSFSETVGMQADIRQVWSDADAPNGINVKPFDDDETLGNTYLNLGLIINFGAPKKVVAAAPLAEPVSNLPEVAPYDEESYPFAIDEPEEVGPQKPAFEKITLQAEVLFDFDKSVVKEEGKSHLDAEVVEKMKAHPEVELVLISGHTDRIGSDSYNQALSERRAAAVKDYLVSQGVAAERLHTQGKGETEPVVDCKGVRGKQAVECLQPNRRVTVEIEAQRITE
jgi:OOP family OmpA-OmpF porin